MSPLAEFVLGFLSKWTRVRTHRGTHEVFVTDNVTMSTIFYEHKIFVTDDVILSTELDR